MEIRCSRSVRLTVLAFLAASAYACSSDSATAPDATQSTTLATVLDEASLPVIEAVGATLIGVPFPMPPTASLASSGCAYDGSTLSFVCPRVTFGRLTTERSYTLYDGSGNAQAQFGTSTVAVRTKTHVAGTLTVASGTVTLDFADDRTVSGLGTAQHVLNGTSRSSMDGTFGIGASALEPTRSTSLTTIDNMVLPSAGHRWPGPGTLTSDNTSSFGTSPPMSFHVQAVFNGTRCVVISFTSEGISQTVTIDLSRGDVVAGCTP
jgi:hypothetical protein